MDDTALVVTLVGAVVGITMLFAQVRLFSIDKTLKAILQKLQERDLRK
jgi:hypothetical protein